MLQTHENIPLMLFDGSWTGLLTAVFEAFERKILKIRLVSQEHYAENIFDIPILIESQTKKAERVWKGLLKRMDSTSRKHFFYTYLSEQPEAFQHLLDYAIYIFSNKENATKNYGHPDVLAISQIAKNVSRESHRMKAFIRFERWNDMTYFALIQPDFNVIPVIAKHFKDRYADQKWIIYDKKRHYGIFYDLHSIIEVNFDFVDQQYQSASLVKSVEKDPLQEKYELLWKDYFKSTNIQERKNMKLHIRHVPKRYWRFLTEKDLSF